jgi:hypothetical protein
MSGKAVAQYMGCNSFSYCCTIEKLYHALMLIILGYLNDGKNFLLRNNSWELMLFSWTFYIIKTIRQAFNQSLN